MLVMYTLSHAMVLADSSAWSNMFVLPLPLIEKILRPILVYFFLVIGLRVAGKRELAQLNPFDLVVLLMLSNTVQNAIIGNENSITGGMIGAATLLALNYVVVRAARHSKRLTRLLEGRSDVLIWHGKINERNMERELMSKADILAAAHKQGIASLRDVERCVLEPTGTITFVEKTPTHENERHEQLMTTLRHLMAEVASLRAGGAAPASAASAPNNPA